MKVIAIANYRGEEKALKELKTVVEQEKADFLVFTGGIVQGTERIEEFQSAEDEGREADTSKITSGEAADLQEYETFFKALGGLNIPVYYIPGKYDAPIERFLREAYNSEIVYPHIRNVHKSFSFYRNHYEIVGFGGEISEKQREERFILRYPRWELEYHLKIIRDLKPLQLIMLFYSPPYGGKLDLINGNHTGSEAVKDFIKTYDPVYAFVGSGSEQGEEFIGNTRVINPGSLKDGKYVLVNMRNHKVEFRTL